ncbi:MAG: nuclear transport factor 2 family protein [Solirubrobacterales bacterium]
MSAPSTEATAVGDPPTTSEAQAEAWVAEFIEGWRARTGPDGFADHFERVSDPEIRLIQPQMPTVVGHRAFREQLVRPLFDAIPDIHATVHDWAARGDRLFIAFTLEGTLGGKPVAWDCVDRITLRDGVAVERRAYFDPTPLLRAVATRPRAWPSFLRLQARQLFQTRTKGSA